jgi:RNA polymerase sigma-70 factor (ECF subfamily)
MAIGHVKSEWWSGADSAADEHLAIAARRDTDAFAELYRRYADEVLRYCLRRLGDRSQAEDATSQTFEQALRAIPRFRSSSFRAWLFTIARNVTIDFHRRQRHHEPLPGGDDLIDHAAQPESVALARDGALQLRMLLGSLSHDQRDVMELRLAGLSNAEIGKVLGKRLGAVRMATYRAVANLRISMKENGFEFDER